MPRAPPSQRASPAPPTPPASLLDRLVTLAKEQTTLTPAELAAEWTRIQDAIAAAPDKLIKAHDDAAFTAADQDKYFEAMVGLLFQHRELGASVQHLLLATGNAPDTDRDEDPSPIIDKLNENLLRACPAIKSLSLVGRARRHCFATLWAQAVKHAGSVESLTLEAYAYDVGRLVPGLVQFANLRQLSLKEVGVEFDEYPEADEHPAPAGPTLRLTSLTLVDVGDVVGYQTHQLSGDGLAWLLHLSGPGLAVLRCEHRGYGEGRLWLEGLKVIPAGAPQLTSISLKLAVPAVKDGVRAVTVLLQMAELKRLELGVARATRRDAPQEREQAVAELREGHAKLSEEAKAKVVLVE